VPFGKSGSGKACVIPCGKSGKQKKSYPQRCGKRGGKLPDNT
jgi:hypothetical protein